MHIGRALGVKLFTATAGGVHVLTLLSVIFLFLFNNFMFLNSGRCDGDYAANQSCHCPTEVNRTAAVVRRATGLSTPDGPLAVVFTTFKDTADRVFFQSNTVRNWGEQMPLLQPVLFTVDKFNYLTRLAGSKGWHVYTVPRANDDGTPFLKDMVDVVRDRYPNAIYYGFANGDILFDNGLLRTLKGLWRKSERLANDHVIIGRRINMKLDTSSWRPLYKPADIEAKVAHEGGKLFIPDAEDYFFFRGEYPWYKIPDVVMGRPGYDNFIVFTAIESNVTVIDVTKTMLAFHQTGLDGEFAGTRNIDRSYNSRLIGKFDTWKGMIVSAQYQTHFDVAGDLSVEQVVPIWKLTWQRKELEERNRKKQLHRHIKNAVPVKMNTSRQGPSNSSDNFKHRDTVKYRETIKHRDTLKNRDTVAAS